MNDEEKILLIKLLLEDIRCNWSYDCDRRAGMAYELAQELYKNTNDEKWNYISNRIASYEGGEDGRYFRYSFPEGYIGMEKLYNISETYKDKSDEFKAMAKNYLTYPEYRFKDFEEEEGDL